MPEHNFVDTAVNRLTRFQRTQQLVQHFWARWSKEFVSELQFRRKWNKNKPNLQIGSLVLVKENNLPPMCWLLGRVIDIHPGADGVVRIVTIRTKSGSVKRAAAQVCVLPLESDNNLK